MSTGKPSPDNTGVANRGVIRPPLVYLGTIIIGISLHFLWPVPITGRALSLPIGVIIVLAAITLFVSAVRTFRNAGTPVPGNLPTTTIVHSGPYRFSRNPIYLAFSLLQCGIGFCINSLWPLATLIPAVALMSFVVIPREEHYLERLFPDYARYKASVRRWL